MTKVTNQTVNPNFEILRKSLGLMSVNVYPDMMVYRLPSASQAKSAATMALRIIKQLKLPLTAHQPSAIINTFYIKAAVLPEMEVCHVA